MIGRLVGEVAELEISSALLDVQGVGYTVFCPVSTLSGLSLGEQATLTIHTEMRDSEIRLYGFHSALQKQLFEFLLQVNGVGPKSALEILSSFDASELIRVLGSGEVQKIQKAKGIGKKTAERIVLELKDKVSTYAVESSGLRESIEVVSSSSVTDDAIEALLSLGFSKGDAESAVNQASTSAEGETARDPGEMVKVALSYL